jgi:hypothetical protein
MAEGQVSCLWQSERQWCRGEPTVPWSHTPSSSYRQKQSPTSVPSAQFVPSSHSPSSSNCVAGHAPSSVAIMHATRACHRGTVWLMHTCKRVAAPRSRMYHRRVGSSHQKECRESAMACGTSRKDWMSHCRTCHPYFVCRCLWCT